MKQAHDLGANEPVGEWVLSELQRPRFLDDCTLCGAPVLGPFYFNSRGYGWIAHKNCVDALHDVVIRTTTVLTNEPTTEPPVVVTAPPSVSTAKDDYSRTEAILSDISASLRLLARIWESKETKQ